MCVLLWFYEYWFWSEYWFCQRVFENRNWISGIQQSVNLMSGRSKKSKGSHTQFNPCDPENSIIPCTTRFIRDRGRIISEWCTFASSTTTINHCVCVADFMMRIPLTKFVCNIPFIHFWCEWCSRFVVVWQKQAQSLRTVGSLVRKDARGSRVGSTRIERTNVEINAHTSAVCVVHISQWINSRCVRVREHTHTHTINICTNPVLYATLLRNARTYRNIHHATRRSLVASAARRPQTSAK